MTDLNSDRFITNRSVGTNLSISLIIVIVIVTTSTALVLAYITSSKDRHNLENRADEALYNIIKSVEFPIWNFDNDELAKITEIYLMSEYISELVITDLYTQCNLADYNKNREDKDLVTRNGTVFHNGAAIASIHLGLTKSFNRAKLVNLFWPYILTTTILIFILVILIDYLLKIFLKRPFDNLILGMEKISQGDYSYDASALNEKEFQFITRRFMHMARQVHKREKGLNRARNYINDIFNSIDSIIAGVDFNLKITHWNKSANEFTGLSIEDVKDQSFFDIFPQFREIYEIIWNAVNSQIPQKECRLSTCVADELKNFSISVLPLSFEADNGEVEENKGAVVMIQDISERVKLDEIIIQTEKMLSVGGLAAGMAHEINNPLAGIMQNVQVIENRVLKEDIPANIKAAQQCGITMPLVIQYMELRKIPDLFDSARSAGKRASRIIENMLSFSRKSDSALLENDLVDIFNNTVELAANDYDLKKKYDFKNIKIIREFEPNLKKVPCDSTKIQQVILNILKNGAQAMSANDMKKNPPCFTVRIRERVVTKPIETGELFNNIKTQKVMELEIADNGSGMDEETRKRIFEPFFTTKSVGVGTGLGLSVSYFIIKENHNGTMSVQSSPGNGAVFTIRLPLNGENSVVTSD